MTINAVDVIKTKRDGYRLSDQQIRWMIMHYAGGLHGYRCEVAQHQRSMPW
jgi:thymidine phosphorylase